MKTIFVSMATMDDSETIPTIKNMFSAAKFPERIYLGVSCIAKNTKDLKKEEKKHKNIKVKYTKIKKNNWRDIFGTGNGRFTAMSLYSDQDYALQIDSHTLFTDNWDEYLINLFEEAKVSLNYDKIVLTNYLPRYSYDPERKAHDHESCYSYYVPRETYKDTYPKFLDMPLHEMEQYSKISYEDKFYPAVKISGHCTFGDKLFAQNNNIYKEAEFYDEEIIQSIELHADKFYMVHPNVRDFPLHHQYTADETSFGGSRSNMSHYMIESQQQIRSNDARNKYYSYLNNPDNQEKNKKYEKYAKISLKAGAFKGYYVPEHYNEVENG
jgi:hypothetical protein